MPEIFEEIVRMKREGSEGALATVVGGEKGVPGKMGFRMLVYPDGRISGTVGGGLLEAKVREEALRCLDDKKPRLREFALGEESANGIGVFSGRSDLERDFMHSCQVALAGFGVVVPQRRLGIKHVVGPVGLSWRSRPF